MLTDELISVLKTNPDAFQSNNELAKLLKSAFPKERQEVNALIAAWKAGVLAALILGENLETDILRTMTTRGGIDKKRSLEALNCWKSLFDMGCLPCSSTELRINLECLNDIDNEKNRKVLELAAMSGNVSACHSLFVFYYSKQDFYDAVAFLRKSAEYGNPEDQFFLGQCLFTGKHIPTDKEEAIYWLKKAAESDIMDALVMLGGYYLDQKMEPDFPAAVQYLEKAALQNSGLAFYRLGICAMNGLGMPVNQEKAFQYFDKGAKLNEPNCLYHLSDCYLYGKGVQEDYNQAFRNLRKSADLGCMEAIKTLVIMFLSDDAPSFSSYIRESDIRKYVSVGLKQNDADYLMFLGIYYRNTGDFETSLDLFKKAAAAGKAEAYYMIWTYYNEFYPDTDEYRFWFEETVKHLIPVNIQDGNDIYNIAAELYNEKRYAEALPWAQCFVKNTEKPIGYYLLGMIYSPVIHNSLNDEKLYIVNMTFAAEKGYLKAQVNLALYYYDPLYDNDQALKWFLLAAEQGDAYSMYMVGVIYYEEGDFENAVEYFQKGADANEENSQYMLSMCYMSGYGTDYDIAKGCELMKKAAANGSDEAKEIIRILRQPD